MKKQFILTTTILAIAIVALSFVSGSKSIHSFTVKDIDGKDFKMSSLKGKKVMVVNVASKCGFTPQYEDLQALYKKYKGKNFEIVAFPANNFMKQEPGTNKEIKEFCTSTYKVTFHMMSKISVKGDDIAPIYKWLTTKKENGVMDSEVKWNFQKYLIDEDGKLVKVIGTRTKPNDKQIIDWIEGK
jgi:glutathione peroxidase